MKNCEPAVPAGSVAAWPSPRRPWRRRSSPAAPAYLVARAAGAVALRVAALQHEVRHHAVEGQAVVEAVAHEPGEGVGDDPADLRVERDADDAARRLQDRGRRRPARETRRTGARRRCVAPCRRSAARRGCTRPGPSTASRGTTPRSRRAPTPPRPRRWWPLRRPCRSPSSRRSRPAWPRSRRSSRPWWSPRRRSRSRPPPSRSRARPPWRWRWSRPRRRHPLRRPPGRRRGAGAERGRGDEAASAWASGDGTGEVWATAGAPPRRGSDASIRDQHGPARRDHRHRDGDPGRPGCGLDVERAARRSERARAGHAVRRLAHLLRHRGRGEGLRRRGASSASARPARWIAAA